MCPHVAELGSCKFAASVDAIPPVIREIPSAIRNGVAASV